MKKKLILIGCMVLAALAIIFSLNANVNKKTQAKNGFNRQMLNINPELLFEVPFDADMISICGMNGDQIYMGTSVAGVIYTVTATTRNVDSIIVPIPEIQGFSRSFNTQVEYPIVYITSSYAKCRYAYNLLTKKADTLSLKTGGFTNPVVLPNGDLVVKAVDTPSLNSRFKKVYANTGMVLSDRNLLPGLGDAGMILDGKLSFDRQTGLFIYVCYYNNRITAFDTALNLVFHSHTIDTVKYSPIKVKKAETYVSVAKPPYKVNGYSTAANGKIYVKSMLKADNEPEQKNKTRIEIYQGTSGKYQGTIYIPKPAKHLQSFQIEKDKIIVLNKHKMSIYSIKLGV